MNSHQLAINFDIDISQPPPLPPNPNLEKYLALRKSQSHRFEAIHEYALNRRREQILDLMATDRYGSGIIKDIFKNQLHKAYLFQDATPLEEFFIRFLYMDYEKFFLSKRNKRLQRGFKLAIEELTQKDPPKWKKIISNVPEIKSLIESDI